MGLHRVASASQIRPGYGGHSGVLLGALIACRSAASSSGLGSGARHSSTRPSPTPGHVWNDTKRDFAIDGQIEFVDADREVTVVVVLAQVKGTEVGFLGGTETEFTFMCKADHIAYCLRLGCPVVLICVDLRVQQAACW